VKKGKEKQNVAKEEQERKTKRVGGEKREVGGESLALPGRVKLP